MIELKDVSYAYPSADGVGTETLHNVNFAVQPGELVALVGANGAGKSTLGRVLCGTYAPESGEVLSDGESVSGDALHQLVGYVRQDPASQLVAPTVFDEVAFGPCNLGLAEAEVLERIAWALKAVGLSGYEERLVSELSGGELQRLALAGVLACRPSFLVLDEVTSQLDYESRDQLREIIAEQVAAGTGVVMIAHDAIEVARAQRVVLMEAGHIVWQGNPAEFFASSERLTSACMRIPVAPELTNQKTPQGNSVLQLEHVSVSYESNMALADVFFGVAPGEILLVAGRSGSGKSTLANVASGLLEPTSGKALLNGEPVRVSQVGLCMQRPEAQLFCETILDDVAFAPKNQGKSPDEAHEIAAQALGSFGIAEELWNTSPFMLSGGQRRRVALAGIVALGTSVLVFDEPTVGLDATGCNQLKRTIVELAREGKAIVVVSHDVDEWLDVASSVALMSAGKLIWAGQPAELMSQSHLLAQAGLGAAPWEQMSSELSRLGVEGALQSGEAHE